VPTLNDVLAGSQAQAVQVQQIIDALKGTPNKGVPVALVSLNDPNNYALTVQNDDPVNSRALSVLKADGTTLISADATGVTLGAPVNVPPGSISGTAIAAGSITNAMLGADVARANLLANGGMAIAQRGNGPFNTNGVFSADRWQVALGGASTISVSCATAGIGPSGGTVPCVQGSYVHSTASYLLQQLKFATDGNHVGLLAGQTVSLSMRVWANAANAVRISLVSDGAAPLSAVSSFHPGTSLVATLTVTGLVPNDATVLNVQLNFVATCSQWYAGQAMLVVGSQPANYAPLHPADDLARCLRYYEVIGTPTASDIDVFLYQAAGSPFALPFQFRAIKPVTPTVTKVGTWTVTNCAQPTAAGPCVTGFFLSGVASALGPVNFVNTPAGTFLTAEANP
jgi:hypothetical protein